MMQSEPHPNGLICARPAWLTLLTDVSALPRVARLGIMQDVFRWSVVVYTRIVPPAGCRPLRRRRAEASARICRRGRVLDQHCCPDPAAYRPATRAVLASSCAPDSHGLAPRRGTDTDIRTTASRFACKVPSWSGFSWPVAWLGEPAGPAAPYQVVGQMTIHDNTGVDCR
jgi:hypothetical protein